MAAIKGMSTQGRNRQVGRREAAGQGKLPQGHTKDGAHDIDGNAGQQPINPDGPTVKRRKAALRFRVSGLQSV